MCSFNNVHAFSMCDYYVEMLCAGKFGLGWAHDTFNILCHMFMHFSCICINFYFYHLILNCLVLFCVSLSLSFCFVSCFMAPKRKSTSSWNLLCFEASSSTSPSDTIPSHVRFRDDKARKDLLKNFSWRGIHSERQVVLSGFSDTDLPTVIYSRGWESLCGIPVTCPSMIIQEFYSNMHRFDYSIRYFVTDVRGTRIVVTLDIVF